MSPLGRSLFILNNWFIHLYIIPLILFRPLLTTISWNTEISSVFRSALRFWFVSRIESLSSNRTNEEVIVAINAHREVEWKIEFSPMMASDNKNPNQNVNGYTQISLTDDRISVPQRACVWCAAPRQLYRSALLMFFFMLPHTHNTCALSLISSPFYSLRRFHLFHIWQILVYLLGGDDWDEERKAYTCMHTQIRRLIYIIVFCIRMKSMQIIENKFHFILYFFYFASLFFISFNSHSPLHAGRQDEQHTTCYSQCVWMRNALSKPEPRSYFRPILASNSNQKCRIVMLSFSFCFRYFRAECSMWLWYICMCCVWNAGCSTIRFGFCMELYATSQPVWLEHTFRLYLCMNYK